MEHGRVREVKNATEYYQCISTAGTGLVVVDFYAQWCGPCRFIAPQYIELSDRYQDVLFLKVDTDQLKSVATSSQIQVLPTFHLIRQGEKIAESRGANIAKLEELILQHRTAADVSTTTPKDDFAYPAGQSDLSILIEPQAECLNQSASHPWKNVLNPDTEYLESDSDEQLLLSLPFAQPVKLHSLAIKAPKDKGPRVVKLYINQLHVDFSSVGDVTPTQELELKKNLILPSQ